MKTLSYKNKVGGNEITVAFLKKLVHSVTLKEIYIYLYISDVIMSLQLEILTECYCTKIHSEKCPWSLLLFFFFSAEF